MLLTFRKYLELNHSSIRSEDIDHVDEDLGHAIIVTKTGDEIPVWGSFNDVVKVVNQAFEKDAANKTAVEEKKEKEETITLSEARARLNSIFGKK